MPTACIIFKKETPEQIFYNNYFKSFPGKLFLRRTPSDCFWRITTYCILSFQQILKFNKMAVIYYTSLANNFKVKATETSENPCVLGVSFYLSLNIVFQVVQCLARLFGFFFEFYLPVWSLQEYSKCMPVTETVIQFLSKFLPE